MSSINAIRSSAFTNRSAEGSKNKVSGKPADKENKAFALAHSTFPANASLPATLRALGTAGLRITVPLTGENEETTTSGTTASDSEGSLFTAYLHLRGVPEGMEGMLANENPTEEEAQATRELVLALAYAVLSYEGEPHNYTPKKVPNTLANARKELAAQSAYEAQEATNRAKKNATASNGSAATTNRVSEPAKLPEPAGTPTNGKKSK